MTTFRFVSSSPDKLAETEKANPIDALIGAAGGSPLPGKFGLVQALLGIWTAPKYGPTSLHVGKLCLNTAGVFRAYQRTKDPIQAEKMEDPVKAFLDTKKLKPVEWMNGTLDHLIYSYMGKLPEKEFRVGVKNKGIVRSFQTPGGVDIYFTFWGDSGQVFSDYGFFLGRGPFIRVEQREVFYIEISKLAWEHGGNADLQLSMFEDTWGYHAFSISNIGTPGDYVSEGAAENWTSVEKLAKRCQAFKDRGLSRKILFFGPPGCGKTTLARSLARKVGSGNTLRIEAKAIEQAGSKGVLQFVRLLRPRVLLFDDLDRCRESAVEILHYMEQLGEEGRWGEDKWMQGILLVGTVNSIEQLDPALLRPGRFDEVVPVIEPCPDHRLAIIKHYLQKYQPEGLDASGLSQEMEGFSPADIREVIASTSTVGVEHLEAELGRIRRQRELYKGDKVEVFLDRNRSITKSTTVSH